MHLEAGSFSKKATVTKDSHKGPHVTTGNKFPFTYFLGPHYLSLSSPSGDSSLLSSETIA